MDGTNTYAFDVPFTTEHPLRSAVLHWGVRISGGSAPWLTVAQGTGVAGTPASSTAAHNVTMHVDMQVSLPPPRHPQHTPERATPFL